MQKWEYCVIGKYELVLFTPNGLKIEKIKRDKAKGDIDEMDAVYRRIAELGLEGWELVSTEVAPVRHYFKRPLSEAEESEG